MNGTGLGIDQYRIEQPEAPGSITFVVADQMPKVNSTFECIRDRSVSLGPVAQLVIEEAGFADLVQELLDYEKRHGISTLEVFARYLDGQIDHEHVELEDWVSLFLLYLGTDEIRQFSCR